MTSIDFKDILFAVDLATINRPLPSFTQESTNNGTCTIGKRNVLAVCNMFHIHIGLDWYKIR